MKLNFILNRGVAVCATLFAAMTPAVAGSVVLSTPTNNQSVSSPIHIVATGTSSVARVTAMQVYLDNTLAYTVSSATLDTNVSASTGSHRLTIKAWDASGANYSAVVSVNVTSGSTSGDPTAPSTSRTYSAIESMSGWQSCSYCAGAGGAGPVVPYSLRQGVSTPSMDGSSAEFWLGGTTPFGAALWWKQLGANASASNFVYDLYFYLKTPAASQALEFDVNQSVGGYKYIFGTECTMKETRTWRVWSQYSWTDTGIPCPVPSAYTWHHVTLEFQRTSTKQVKFISVTLDGRKSYINKNFAARGSGSQELNVAFQMDGNSHQDDYSTWVDKVKLLAW